MIPNLIYKAGATCDPRPLLDGSGVSFDGVDGKIVFWDSTTKYLTGVDLSDMSLIEVTVTNEYLPTSSIDLFNIKIWSSNTYTNSEALDYVTSPDLAWYGLDESNGVSLLDRLIQNGNNSNLQGGASWISSNEFSFRDNYGYSFPTDNITSTLQNLTFSGQTSAIDITNNGETLTKNTGANLWTDANIWSNETYSESVAFTFRVDSSVLNSNTMLGITDASDNANSFNDIDLAMYLNMGSAVLRIYSNGTAIGSNLSLAPTVDYWMNAYYDFNTKDFTIWTSQFINDTRVFNFSLTNFKLKLSFRDIDAFVNNFRFITVPDGLSVNDLNDVLGYYNTYIPRDESNQDFDVLGNDLEHKGKACNII